LTLPLAHALQEKQDLPLPEWLFVWGAALVLIVSFIALAALWPRPKLEEEDEGWRPLPGGSGWRAVASAPVQILCGAIGVFLLGVVVWSGFAGEPNPTGNFAPTFVFVTFWLGLVPVSVVFGDVFRAFNPWRALGKAAAWVGETVARRPLPAALPYPERLGRWPAAVGLVLFVFLELDVNLLQENLGVTAAEIPQKVAIATLVYTAATLVAMSLYGVDAWIERGETFSVYFNLFSRISPYATRDGVMGIRRPLSGLASLEPLPGTVVLLAAMIGTVTFDGATEGPLWGDNGLEDDVVDFFAGLGFNSLHAAEAATGLGMLVTIALLYGFYRLGAAGARRMGGGLDTGQLARAFVHSLVPIALVYAAAHYFTFLLFRGQAIAYLASNPLGRDWDLFGTADDGVDYGLIGSETTWYVQVALVILGHVAALMLAHDRALALFDRPGVATRSQYWMLGVMVGFTCLALWLLSQANQ
jgi:hypothetical protein